jgi:hypothetical protein
MQAPCACLIDVGCAERVWRRHAVMVQQGGEVCVCVCVAELVYTMVATRHPAAVATLLRVRISWASCEGCRAVPVHHVDARS